MCKFTLWSCAVNTFIAQWHYSMWSVRTFTVSIRTVFVYSVFNASLSYVGCTAGVIVLSTRVCNGGHIMRECAPRVVTSTCVSHSETNRFSLTVLCVRLIIVGAIVVLKSTCLVSRAPSVCEISANGFVRLFRSLLVCGLAVIVFELTAITPPT